MVSIRMAFSMAFYTLRRVAFSTLSFHLPPRCFFRCNRCVLVSGRYSGLPLARAHHGDGVQLAIAPYDGVGVGHNKVASCAEAVMSPRTRCVTHRESFIYGKWPARSVKPEHRQCSRFPILSWVCHPFLSNLVVMQVLFSSLLLSYQVLYARVIYVGGWVRGGFRIFSIQHCKEPL